MMFYRKRVLFVLLLIVTIFVGVVFFYSVVLTMSLRSISHQEAARDGGLNSYNYFLVDTEKEDVFSGNLDLSFEIEGQSTFFKDGSKHYLIGHFEEGDEYCCTGSCYCMEENEDNNRRVAASFTSKMLTRSYLFLATAVSSTIAFKKAKEYFEQYCRDELKDECPAASVRTYGRGCGKGRGGCSWFLPENAKDVAEDLLKEQLGKSYFSCTGFCIVNPDLLQKEHQNQAKKERCHTIEHMGGIPPTGDDFETRKTLLGYEPEDDELEISVEELMDDEEEDVRKLFQKKLDRYCRDKTYLPLPDDEAYESVDLCAGDPNDGSINESIKCFRMGSLESGIREKFEKEFM